MHDISLASDVPMEDITLPGEDISPSPSSALHVQATRDPVGIPAGDTVLPGGAAARGQEAPGLLPGDSWEHPAPSQQCPKAQGHRGIRMRPEEPRQDAGTLLPPPQGSMAQHYSSLEKCGKQQQNGSWWQAQGPCSQCWGRREGLGCCRDWGVLGRAGGAVLIIFYFFMIVLFLVFH